MLSAKQGHYWYHFYNVFGMTGLSAGPAALDASTLPLGYRGGGMYISENVRKTLEKYIYNYSTSQDKHQVVYSTKTCVFGRMIGQNGRDIKPVL